MLTELKSSRRRLRGNTTVVRTDESNGSNHRETAQEQCMQSNETELPPSRNRLDILTSLLWAVARRNEPLRSLTESP